MDNIKVNIAKNISELRKKMGITQFELAEKLNYSDKAVSKWERGESVPDISVLKSIADLFGVTVDYLITEEHKDFMIKKAEPSKRKKHNRSFITGISIVLVWLIATLVYSFIDMAFPSVTLHWLAFVYAVPVSVIVWLIFNSIWFNARVNFAIISVLMWTVLAAICITFLPFGFKFWMIFVPGIPGQVIIGMWSGIRTKSKE